MTKFVRMSLVFLVPAVLVIALACGPAATSTPTPAPTNTPTPTRAATATPTATPGPTATPTATPTPLPPGVTPPTATPTRPATPTPTPTATATPRPTATPVPKVVPKGTVTGVVGGLGVGTPSGWPTDCLWCSNLVMVGNQESLLAVVRASGAGIAGGLDVAPWLAESWALGPDNKYIDFKLRRGVQFHRGFGELTADDVVYTFTAGDPAFTTGAAHDTLPNASWGKVEAVDKYTVRVNLKAFNPLSIIDFADYGEGIGIFPKKAADEKGSEWMRTNFIGTGPFEITEWTAQKGMYMQALPEHWKQTAFIERFRLLEVSEDATRLAMLLTGEAQMGEVALKDWAALLSKGYKRSDEEVLSVWQIIFGGQYWEKTSYPTGEPLKYGPERVLDLSKPWIGDPWGAGCNYDAMLKTAVPTGPVCDSMEKPRKVRLALAMDIDREAINDTILQKQGKPSYISVPVDDPIWKANEAKWKIPYDPVKAKQLLAEAGYPNGITTPIPWWIGPAGIEVEISDAVAAGWLADLNVRVEFDRRVYSAQRPNMITRTSNWLQTRNCCAGIQEGAGEWIRSSHVPTGYNHAQEDPFMSFLYAEKLKAKDVQTLTQLTVQTFDHRFFWMTEPSIVQNASTTLYNTNVIASWGQRPYAQWRLGGMRNNMEFIKLK